jgi:hypothetical protein
VILSEYGPDLSRFPDEKHFVSHLTLAPRQAISGGKAVTKKKKKGTASTRVAAALRMAALCLRNSKTALGAFYRQISRRLGEMSLSSPPPENWQPSSTVCFGGGSLMSIRERPLMKNSINTAASAI